MSKHFRIAMLALAVVLSTVAVSSAAMGPKRWRHRAEWIGEGPPAQIVGALWLLGADHREFFDDVSRVEYWPLADPTFCLRLRTEAAWEMLEMDWEALEGRSVGELGDGDLFEVVVHALTGKLFGRMADGDFLPICRPAPERHLTESLFDSVGYSHVPGVGGGSGGFPVIATPQFVSFNTGGFTGNAGGGGEDPFEPREQPPLLELPPLNPPGPLNDPDPPLDPPTNIPDFPVAGPTVDPRPPVEDPRIIPEPLSLSMLLIGAAALAAARRRRKRK